MSAPVTAPPVETVADLLARLGDVPPQRVRLHPTPGTATEQDVIAAEGRIGRLCELVDGTLVEKAVGFYESSLAAVLIGYLHVFLTEHDLGIVLGEAGMVRVEGQVRMPDVAFYSWDHFPDHLLPRGAILRQPPDLAVEVISRSNTEREMARKRREYFAGGARLVWQVYPNTRRVRVYTSVEEHTVLGENDSLDGGPVLPGFTVTVRRVFERAGARRQARNRPDTGGTP